MAISGFNPITALPPLGAGGTVNLAGSNPLLAGSGAVPTGGMLAAQHGVVERPGIGSRLVSAMKAAIGELRGSGSGMPNGQVLPMQHVAQPVVRPVAKPRPKARPKAKARTAKVGARQPAGPKPAVRPAAAAGAVAGAAAATGIARTQLPANAAVLPGATVYSYDANGRPVAPTMQQLGITPTMLQGLTGMADGLDPSGPQLNATNQTNLSGTGSGVGGIGSAVPVLGQPILMGPPGTPATPSGPPPTPHNGSSSGGSQVVTNRNSSDQRHQGLGGYGYGGVGGYGGIATPGLGYGSSMTGASLVGQEPHKRGFLSRLFG